MSGYDPRPMWKLLQVSIFVAVAVSNIEYQWTPNPLLVAIIGGLAAYVATVTLSWMIELPTRRRLKKRSLLVRED